MEDAAVLATEGGEGSGLPVCSSTPENCQLSPRGSRASHVLIYQTHLGVMWAVSGRTNTRSLMCAGAACVPLKVSPCPTLRVMSGNGFPGLPVTYWLSQPAPPWVCLPLRPWRGVPGPGHPASSSCARTQPWPAAAPWPRTPAPCCLSPGPACSFPDLLWTRRGEEKQSLAVL